MVSGANPRSNCTCSQPEASVDAAISGHRSKAACSVPAAVLGCKGIPSRQHAVHPIVGGAVQQEALAGGARNRGVTGQQLPPLRKCVCHAVTEDESPTGSCGTVGGQQS